MKILVTGGAGFIASHIVDEYINQGHDVFIIDNLSTGDEKNINPKATFKNLDIRSREAYEFIINENFDIVNHHAAQIDVRIGVKDPIFDADINIIGSLNIINASIHSKVKKVIFVSSGGAVYGEIPDSNLPAKENFPINPISPYGAAKHTIEHYLFLFNKLYNLDYTILRYGNVYGERQGKKGEAGVIAIFIKQLLKGEDCFIFGTGEQLRDYIYVKDIVNINMICSFKFNIHNNISHFIDPIYNVGTSLGISVNDLYNVIINALKVDNKAIYKPPREGEILKTYIDCTKAKNELNWEASIDIKTGTANTINWFKNNKKI